MRLRFFLAFGGCILFLTGIFGCQPKPANPPIAPVLPTTMPAGPITRVYDVRDLIITVVDFDDEPDFSARHLGSTTLPSPQRTFRNPLDFSLNNSSQNPDPPTPTGPDPARDELIRELITCIKTTIAPDAWKTGATIREIQGHLIVIAPIEVHSQLTAFLADARERHLDQVTLEARILKFRELRPEGHDPLLAKKLRLARSTVSPRGGIELTDRECNLLLRMVQADTNATITTQPQITLFTGQHGYVLVATQNAYVGGYKPKPTGGFEPEIMSADFGTLFSARASVSEDHKQVAVDVRLVLSELRKMDKVPFAAAPAAANLTIDVPDVRVRELRALTSIASGKTVMFSLQHDISKRLGWNAPATQPTTNPAESVEDNFIILLKPTVIIYEPIRHSFRCPSQNNLRASEPMIG